MTTKDQKIAPSPTAQVTLFRASPDASDAIFAKDRISRDEWAPLFDSLASEQAVKRVPVVDGQCGDCCHMSEVDCELAKRVGSKVL